MLPDRLRGLAREDLKAIGRYTQKKWGRGQRNQYLAALVRSFYLLASDPQLGRRCDDVRLGYRRYEVGKHVVFFRLAEGFLEVVRILHSRMDMKRHISAN
ncbi:type II toxin-antitoxin system RelE/ParE family toxin [Methylomonas koyamae]|uniref:Toxin n=1 Tax=Methylomonas koyamae TaxID=702114 RepID=A0A177P1A8_9GAMM|nr:type II toxin-antitoxin system RelE/ParE family toxin [Methylomonas koyamae]OAI23100.1 plasmid stabilization protein ParE [Methylomonas koyamae]